MSRGLVWQRTDTSGAEYAALDERNGLAAHGVAVADDPLPYACRYDLTTDGGWASTRFDAHVEGAGWQRSVRMERASGRWRVTASEKGDLDAALRAAGRRAAPLAGSEDPERLADALDVDLYASPLTNTLPLRRLRLLDAEPGTATTITAAWVLLPSLAVIASEQTYTVLGAARVRYTSGTFTAELELDADGYVTRYPGLARR